MKARLVVRQLPFVNNKPCFKLTLKHLRNDLVERDHFRFDAGCEKLQDQIGSRHRSRDSNALTFDIGNRKGAMGDNHGTIAFSYTSAAWKQGIVVLNIGVSMEGDRRDVVNALHSFPIQSFDVA